MPTKPRLNHVELKELILARFSEEYARHKRLRAKFRRKLDLEPVQKPEKPMNHAIQNKFAVWLSAVIARRLKRYRHSKSLFLPEDFLKLPTPIIQEIHKAMRLELLTKNRKWFNDCARRMFKDTLDALEAMTPYGKNAYDEYWRWVETVFALATEQQVSPIELLDQEGVGDVIARRMYTREEFVTLSEREMSRFVRVDELRDDILELLFKELTMHLEEGAKSRWQEQFNERLPDLNSHIARAKEAYSALVKREAHCIYHGE